MALESASYIPELIDTNPPGTDFVLEGDNHVRMLKTVLQNQFPGAPAAAIINAGEDPSSPDETLTAPANVMLWSPKAIADFIKTYFDGWGLAASIATTMKTTGDSISGQLARNTPTKLPWITPLWDSASGWDAPNNQYTIPQAGIWRVNAQQAINWSGNQGQESWAILDIMVNGAVAMSTRNPKGAEVGYQERGTWALDGLFNLALNDTVYIRLEYDADNLEAITAQPLYSTFEVQRVSDTPA